jgi:hypothetical protein
MALDDWLQTHTLLDGHARHGANHAFALLTMTGGVFPGG